LQQRQRNKSLLRSKIAISAAKAAVEQGQQFIL
jgi:hypothetical protein